MNAHSQYLVCAIHPCGPSSDACPDYAPEPGYDTDLWEPVGAAYYNGELVVTRRVVSAENRLHLLESHPLFRAVVPDVMTFSPCIFASSSLGLPEV
ncbi:hypothetical protein [Synechococcus sp. PCC 6312]|uniref:hypothetical protein n=1 Tax=Synechococcus sp. (strain ATCC 27167 / PCC 6312) TaxID=195253 RepID=UPI0002DF03BE|nr:hypothetical protein [Synechococcus sp. PCC 6312]